jgi:hypothetical protein
MAITGNIEVISPAAFNVEGGIRERLSEFYTAYYK